MHIIPNITTNPVSPRLALLIKQLHKLEPLGDALPAFPKQLTAMRNIRLIDERREQPQLATTAARHDVRSNRDVAPARPQPTLQRSLPLVRQLTSIAIHPKRTVVSAAVKTIEGAMPGKATMQQAERGGASSLMRRVTQEMPAAQAGPRPMEKPALQASEQPLSPVAQFAYANMFAPQAPLQETGAAKGIAANAAASPHISSIPVPDPAPDEDRLAADSPAPPLPTTPPPTASSPESPRPGNDAATGSVKRQESTPADSPGRIIRTVPARPSTLVANVQSPREALLAELLAETARRRASQHLPAGAGATTTPETGGAESQRHSASAILATRYTPLVSPALVKQSHDHPARPPVIVTEHHKPHAVRMSATQGALLAELARRESLAEQTRMDHRHVPDASIRSPAKETPRDVATDQAEHARAAAEVKQASLNLIKELTAKHLAAGRDADRADRLPRYDDRQSPQPEPFHDPTQFAAETARRLAAEVAADTESNPATLIVNTGTAQPTKSALRTFAGNPASPAGKHRLRFSEEVKVKTFDSDTEMDSDYSSSHEVEEAAFSERRRSSVDSALDPIAPQPVHFVGRPIS